MLQQDLMIGTFIKIKDDSIIIDIKEDNVDFQRENFDIEVFLYDKETGFDNVNRDVLVPLFFEKNKKQVIDNILVDFESDVLNIPNELDLSFVRTLF